MRKTNQHNTLNLCHNSDLIHITFPKQLENQVNKLSWKVNKKERCGHTS